MQKASHAPHVYPRTTVRPLPRESRSLRERVAAVVVGTLFHNVLVHDNHVPREYIAINTASLRVQCC